MTWSGCSRLQSPDYSGKEGFLTVQQFLRLATVPFTSGLYQTIFNARVKGLKILYVLYILACKKVKTLEHNVGINGRNESIMGRFYKHKGSAQA